MEPVTENFQEKFILSGELFISKLPYKISTILGSCVSVVLFNRKFCFGGMNHYIFNRVDHRLKISNNQFAEFATENLIRKMKVFDPDLSNCEAKLFGGGKVTQMTNNIGDNNVKVAEMVLRKHKICITSRFVRNECGIKIYFYNFNNKVLVTKLKKDGEV